MKTKFRRILTLVLTLVLICALAVAAFAEEEEEPIESASMTYQYGDIYMTHTIAGYDNYAKAVISFAYEDGEPMAVGFMFDYSGRIDYQYCPEDQIRPSNYVEASKSVPSSSKTGYSVSIDTNTTPTGCMMVDASMRFTTQFVVSNANINHNRPDTIYVAII